MKNRIIFRLYELLVGLDLESKKLEPTFIGDGSDEQNLVAKVRTELQPSIENARKSAKEAIAEFGDDKLTKACEEVESAVLLDEDYAVPNEVMIGLQIETSTTLELILREHELERRGVLTAEQTQELEEIRSITRASGNGRSNH